MKGKVTAYSAAVNAGVIKGEDGKDYQFTRRQWRDKEYPTSKQTVTFENNANRAERVTAKASA